MLYAKAQGGSGDKVAAGEAYQATCLSAAAAEAAAAEVLSQGVVGPAPPSNPRGEAASGGWPRELLLLLLHLAAKVGLELGFRVFQGC